MPLAVAIALNLNKYKRVVLESQYRYFTYIFFLSDQYSQICNKFEAFWKPKYAMFYWQDTLVNCVFHLNITAFDCLSTLSVGFFIMAKAHCTECSTSVRQGKICCLLHISLIVSSNTWFPTRLHIFSLDLCFQPGYIFSAQDC